MMSIRSTARSTSPSMLLRFALALMASVATFPSCAMAMLPAHNNAGVSEGRSDDRRMRKKAGSGKLIQRGIPMPRLKEGSASMNGCERPVIPSGASLTGEGSVSQPV